MRLELVNRASRIQQGLTELIVSRRCSAIWRAFALAIDVRSWPEADINGPTAVGNKSEKENSDIKCKPSVSSIARTTDSY